MRSAAVRSQPFRYSVFIVTTDERVGPEAETYLASDYDLRLFQTWEELTGALKKQPPQAILLDIDTIAEHAQDGVAALAELRSMEPDLVLVALTRSNSRSIRHKAINATVDEYFVAPIDFQEVHVVLTRALEKRTAEIEYRTEQDKEAERQSFHELVGASEAIRLVYEAITRVAHSNSTVLLRGESGTGKELVAKAIVAVGPRSEKPFISINCAALPENLIETELFGHEKGAFTDAQTARPGHIELAHTGTLDTFRPAIGNKFGGLSGPGIKPIIMRMVYQCSKAVKIPIIGCGGIVKVEDAVEYMLAGATAVMIGYLTFRNPTGMIAIIDGLEEWCAKRGFARVADLTGAMIDEPPMETFAAAAAPIG